MSPSNEMNEQAKKGEEGPLRVYYWSMPRSACHLLEKMLSFQPGVNYESHFFEPAVLSIFGSITKVPMNREVLNQVRGIQQEGYESLLKFLDEADKKGVTAFYQDHPCFMLNTVALSEFLHGTNPDNLQPIEGVVRLPENDPYVTKDATMSDYTQPTVVPDKLFLDPRSRHFISLRNPMIQCPSGYKGMRDLLPLGLIDQNTLATGGYYRWARQLYTFLKDHGMNPQIIDMQDYVVLDPETNESKPSPALTKMVKELGLDPDHIQVKWRKLTDAEVQEYPDRHRAMKKDLLASDGVNAEKMKPRKYDLAEEEKKWKKDFNEHEIKMIKHVVENTMEDYEWMFKRRVKA